MNRIGSNAEGSPLLLALAGRRVAPLQHAPTNAAALSTSAGAGWSIEWLCSRRLGVG
jgi:hypothetical protein